MTTCARSASEALLFSQPGRSAVRTGLAGGLGLLLVLLAGCGGGGHGPGEAGRRAEAAARPAVPVTVVRVEEANLPRAEPVPGTVRAVQRATVAAKVQGTIAALPFDLGQSFAAGDLLAGLTAGELGARVLQAQAQVAQAERDLAREKGLLESGATTPDTVRAMEDRVRVARAGLAEAETILSYTEIRAPFAGVVARRHVEEGDLASPGAPLLEIENPAALEVEAGVPDSAAGGLAPGLKLAVETAGRSWEGTVTEVSPVADPVARTVAVRVRLPSDPAIRSGGFARLTVPGPAAPTLTVPAGAVTRAGQMERVFVVEDGRAVLRLVRTGREGSRRVEILAGLAPGETVVAEVPRDLREGDPVEVRP